MKKNNFFLLCFICFGLFTASYAQIENPFLSNKGKKEPPFSVNKRTVLIVFDASGSMEEKIRDGTKIHIAKTVLEDVLLKADVNVNVGLRAYGLKEPIGNPEVDCTDSQLLVFPDINNRRTIISEIYKVLPKGFTPITFSLIQAVKDLTPYKGEKSIILISDGLETCGGDPCELAHQINLQNIDLKIDVVGFGVQDDWQAQEQLMCIALNTMGRYFSANSAEELTTGLQESINKTVTGRVITMLGKETEGYENLPLLKPEKLML